MYLHGIDLFSGFPLLHRNPSQSYPHHGQAGPGSVHAVQAGDREGRPGGGHQQEDLERNHKGTQPANLHHQCSFHPAHTVSLCVCVTEQPAKSVAVVTID